MILDYPLYTVSNIILKTNMDIDVSIVFFKIWVESSLKEHRKIYFDQDNLLKRRVDWLLRHHNNILYLFTEMFMLFSMSQTNDNIGSYSSSLSKCFFRYSMNPLLMDSIGSYCMMPTRRFISHVTSFSLDISPHRFIISSLTKSNGSDFFSILNFFTADHVCI
jgi:hypothetical protein